MLRDVQKERERIDSFFVEISSKQQYHKCLLIGIYLTLCFLFVLFTFGIFFISVFLFLSLCCLLFPDLRTWRESAQFLLVSLLSHLNTNIERAEVK